MSSICPSCKKVVYFAERKTSLGKDWHRACLKCMACNKTLNPGAHSEHNSEPYCNPCYKKNFGPKGYHSSGSSMPDSYPSRE
ncbi:cysteine-rich protein 1-like [Amphiura filiformis]|uniref:cysteine-rich protein 1-like n=1 Tax=Amphiura filiformis TaxID=82378 RepID=UPI003B21293E